MYMENTPLVSIIIPAFNAGLTIEKTIESIENQNYGNFEIIVVDDDSKDNTVDIVKNFADRFANIRLLTNPGKKSVSAGRNYGIDNANGELIMFVDADDRLLPDMLSILYKELVNQNIDICGCSFFAWMTDDEWNSKIVSEPKKINSISYDSFDFLNKEFLNKNNTRCWAKLYKKDAIGITRFDENLVIGEDALFIISLLKKNIKLLELNYQGYGYFQNPNGAMNRSFEPKYMDQITCWEKIREEAVSMDSSTKDMLSMKLLMSIMLVAGKLAKCDTDKKAEYRKYIDICHDKVKIELSDNGGYKLLDRGYKLKVRFFKAFPRIYSMLYRIL